MATIDIREEQDNNVDEVVFWDATNISGTCFVSNKITNTTHVRIEDEDNYVIIENKQHAENLIKALHKAVELGWLK